MELKKSEDENINVKIGQDEILQGVGSEDNYLKSPMDILLSEHNSNGKAKWGQTWINFPSAATHHKKLNILLGLTSGPEATKKFSPIREN